MHFVVVAYDDTDSGALNRRLAVRDAHLQTAKQMFDSGKFLYAVGILDDGGKMIGSIIICDFSSRDDLDEWLREEPYVVGKVWKTIDIHRGQPAHFCTARHGGG